MIAIMSIVIFVCLPAFLGWLWSARHDRNALDVGCIPQIKNKWHGEDR